MRARIACAVAAAGVAAAVAAAPAHATFPGKNGAIAYSYFPGTSNSGSANFEIALLGLESPPAFLPAQNPRKDNWPDWSPDGSQIVFWHAGPAGNFDIYKMSADGSGQVNLTTSNRDADLNAAWSPDGSEIAYESNYRTHSGGYDIVAMDSNGERLREITHNGGRALDSWPQYSPDGKRITFTHGVSEDGSDWGIYTMDADDGGNVVRVTPPGLPAATSDFSPDGSRIVFVDNPCDTCPMSDVWVVDADGSNLTRLTNTPNENEFRPGFSPDGRKITFASIPITPAYPDATLPADVYVMTAEGAGRTNLTNTPDRQERAPDWGPRLPDGD